jgi:hypothetical protein
MNFPNLIVKVSSVMQETAIALNAAARAIDAAEEVAALSDYGSITVIASSSADYGLITEQPTQG